MVVACAGSGKSSTLVCRIKHLVDIGVHEKGIVLTTFTRDAASDMEKKLVSVFGRETNVIVGTIDSLALKYVMEYAPHLISDNSNVGEYAVKFLEFLKMEIASEFFDGLTHLFVDEFQDINDLQYKIIREFYKHGVSITAVGDDAQNIYSFRGSNIKYILNFASYFDDAILHKLTMNFRSSQDIVMFANATIENNEHQIPKAMVSYKPCLTGNKPNIHYFERGNLQYEFIKDQIKKYKREGNKLCQIAVLCPQNSFLYQLEEVLTQYDIPNVLLDGKSDVRTAIKSNHVCLCTVHKSKGLEWDIVFLLQLNDEIFPSTKAYQDISESRRLFYVGTTRPRKLLHITYSPIQNSKFICRFVNEIDPSLYVFNNFSVDCIGLSTKSLTTTKTLKKHIESLTGEDYSKMKEQGVFPEVVQEIVHLYKPHDYNEVTIQHDLYSDFGCFTNVLLSRMIGELRPDSNGFFNESGLLAIHALKLDYVEIMIYYKYKNSFIHNLDKVIPFMGKMYNNMMYIMKAFLSKEVCEDIVPVDSEDMSMILSILSKLNKKSIESGIPIQKIPLFTDKYLPTDFMKSLTSHMEMFMDSSKSWKTEAMMNSIWEVSKCEQIVKERRRRLLYKNVDVSDFKDYNKMWRDMWEYIIPYIVKEDKAVSCYESFADDDQGISGRIDVRVYDTLYEVRNSSEVKVNAENIVRMLCTKQIFQTNCHIKINKIGFINPLKGIITLIDAKDSYESLLEYVLSTKQ